MHIVQTDHLVAARRTELILLNKKERRLEDAVFQWDNRGKMEESEKTEKYLDLARQQKKKMLWNMRVTEIPFEVGERGIIPKGLEKWLEELKIRRRSEIIQIRLECSEEELRSSRFG